MLLHQGARAFEICFGRSPHCLAMRAALSLTSRKVCDMLRAKTQAWLGECDHFVVTPDFALPLPEGED